SPDGRYVLVGRGNRNIHLWELATGRELFKVTGHLGWVRSVAFAPDGTKVATVSEDTTALVWDLAALLRQADPPALPPPDVEAMWGQLAAVDAVKGYEAICALAGSPDRAVALLKEKLKPPAAGVDGK